MGSPKSRWKEPRLRELCTWQGGEGSNKPKTLRTSYMEALFREWSAHRGIKCRERVSLCTACTTPITLSAFARSNFRSGFARLAMCYNKSLFCRRPLVPFWNCVDLWCFYRSVHLYRKSVQNCPWQEKHSDEEGEGRASSITRKEEGSVLLFVPALCSQGVKESMGRRNIRKYILWTISCFPLRSLWSQFQFTGKHIQCMCNHFRLKLPSAWDLFQEETFTAVLWSVISALLPSKLPHLMQPQKQITQNAFTPCHAKHSGIRVAACAYLSGDTIENLW